MKSRPPPLSKRHRSVSPNNGANVTHHHNNTLSSQHGIMSERRRLPTKKGREKVSCTQPLPGITQPFSPPMPSMSFELPCPVVALDELFHCREQQPALSKSRHVLPSHQQSRPLGKILQREREGTQVSPLARGIPSTSSSFLFDFLDHSDSDSTAPHKDEEYNDRRSSVVDHLTLLWIPSLYELSSTTTPTATAATAQISGRPRDHHHEGSVKGGAAEVTSRSSNKKRRASNSTSSSAAGVALSKQRNRFAEWLKHVISDISDQYLSGSQAAKFFDPVVVDDDDDIKKNSGCGGGGEGYAAVVALLDTSSQSPAGCSWESVVLQQRNDDLSSSHEQSSKSSQQRFRKQKEQQHCRSSPNRVVVGLCIGKQLAEARRAVVDTTNGVDTAAATIASNDGVQCSSASTSSLPDASTASLSLSSNPFSDWVSSATQLSENTLRGSIVCGVEIMWVLEPLRRCGIATALVDELRKHLVYGGFEIPTNAVAFSQPTRDGKQFAASFSGRKDFYTFI